MLKMKREIMTRSKSLEKASATSNPEIKTELMEEKPSIEINDQVREKKTRAKRQRVDSPITISLLYKKTASIKVMKTETIQDVKSKFSKIEYVSPNLQKLSFQTSHLENKKQLMDYNIKDGSVLDLSIDSGNRDLIMVNIPQINKSLFLLVDFKKETVFDIKAKIQDEEGIPTNQVTLFSKGEELKDCDTLAGHQLDLHGLYAILRQDNSFLITVKTEDVGDLKLTVKDWYTVGHVKTLIESKIGVRAGKLKLHVEDKELDDENKTLAEYSIEQKKTLSLDYSDIQLFVKGVGGKTRVMLARLSDPIYSLKVKLEKLEEVPVKEQRLVFRSRYPKDNLTLAECNISDESTLQLEVRVGSLSLI